MRQAVFANVILEFIWMKDADENKIKRNAGLGKRTYGQLKNWKYLHLYLFQDISIKYFQSVFQSFTASEADNKVCM